MKRMLFTIALILMMTSATWAQTQRGYSWHSVQAVDELGRNVALTSVQIYLSDTTTNPTAYSDRGLTNAITFPMTTTSTNTTLNSTGQFSWWGPDAWDYSVTDGTRTINNVSGPMLTGSVGQLVLPTWLQVASTTSYTDAQSITLGTDGDFVLNGGTTANRLTVTPAADASTLYIGNGTASVDVRIYGSSASIYAEFNEGTDSLDFVHWDLSLDDDGDVIFGSDSDWTIDSDMAKTLDIIPATTDESSTVNIGSNTSGADFKLFAATTGDYLLWDASDEQLEFVGTDVLMDDDSEIYVGSDKDFQIKSSSTTVLDILPLTTDETSTVNFGANGQGVNMYLFPATSGDYVKWTATGSGYLGFEDSTLSLGDGTALLFGDAVGTGDFSISATSNVLAIEQVVSDTGTITVGANGAGIDVTFYGEEAGDYMKWDGTSASQLQLVGADESGTLLAITGIDTTDNTDSMTIAHSGTGDGLQITCTEADSVAAHFIGATSQTTSILNVDGATGTWLGATGVGMVSITNDGTPDHANASLLRIAQSGTSASGQRGIAASLEDTSTGGGGTPYVLYISSTSNEAIHVDSGAVLVDETITSTAGVQSAAYTAVATDSGLTTGLIPSGTRFVTVDADSDADHVVVLPAAVIGNIITITVPATGAELQTLASSNATINGVDCDGANEMAMAAGSVYQLTCVKAATWIAYGWGSDGAAEATIVPDTDS